MSIKVLTISRSSWNDKNSIGNTFSNIFEGWEREDIANLYCRSEMPDNNICYRYYSITDAQLLRSLIKPNVTAGSSFDFNESEQDQGRNSSKKSSELSINNANEQKNERLIYNFFKIYRSSLFLMLQEIIWYFGRWKSSDLNNFLDKFKPDIIFMPVFQSRYAHRILWYVQQRTKAKIVLFHADDYITMHQHSLSPFFWMNRMLGRRAIKKSVMLSSINYCISQKQVDEYTEILNKSFKILFKCSNFSGEAPLKNIIGRPIKLVFTGNIDGGRWKTLAKIGESLSDINTNSIKAQMDIYTLSPLTKTMEKRLDDNKNIFLKGSLSANEVREVQKAADILVHVESFERKYLLEARLSFSTKIVDYLHQARCILAVGSRECASIEYIEANEAGIVATEEKEIYEKLQMIVDTPTVIREYGYKAYACGARNHQSEKIKEMLKSDLLCVINGNPVNATDI